MKKALFISKITSTLTLLAMFGGVAGGIYGFTQWVDNRYISNEHFLTVSSSTVVAMYDQRIVDLVDHEKYLLEFTPSEKQEIIYVRNQIKVIEKHRLYFLQTGHYPIGDRININQRTILRDFK